MKRWTVLAVDDEVGMLEVITDSLASLEETRVLCESDAVRAAAKLETESFDLLIADIRMPRLDGLELVKRAARSDSTLPILMLTAFPSVDTAVESMRLGASDYLIKPFFPEDLLASARRLLETRQLRLENRLLRKHLGRDYAFDEIIGGSEAMLAVFSKIAKVASSDVDVLIAGETGTGKELVARSIHRRSGRANERFVAIDCGAIPEKLIETELFGHERGAFTGADRRNLGLIELASGGTCFLDEISELPQQLQAKLLRVLQERKFRRVGGREELRLDIRIVSATNRALKEEIRAGRFREDLYFRINVVSIDLPPLRSRTGDLALLVDAFVTKYGLEMGKEGTRVSDEVLDVLWQYPWPGNVRELQNVCKRAVALSEGPELVVDDLPVEVVEGSGSLGSGEAEGFFELRNRRVGEFETSYLQELLVRFAGDVRSAAAKARMPRGTFYRLLKKHGLSADDYRA